MSSHVLADPGPRGPPPPSLWRTIFASTPSPHTVDPGRLSCLSLAAEGLCFVSQGGREVEEFDACAPLRRAHSQVSRPAPDLPSERRL